MSSFRLFVEAESYDERSNIVTMNVSSISGPRWKIQHTLEDVQELVQTFSSDRKEVSVDQDLPSMVHLVELVYDELGENVWKYPIAINFIRDPAPISPFVELEAHRMQSKLQNMEKKIEEHERLLKDYADRFKEMLDLVSSKIEKSEAVPSSITETNSSNSVSGISDGSVKATSDSVKELKHSDEETTRVRLELIPAAPPVSNYQSSEDDSSDSDVRNRDLKKKRTPPQIAQKPSSFSGKSEVCDFSNNIRSVVVSMRPVKQIQANYAVGKIESSDSRTRSSSEGSSAHASGSSFVSGVSNPSDGAQKSESKKIEKYRKAVHSVQRLFADSANVGSQLSRHIENVNAFIDSIRPHPNQIRYRRSVSGLLMKCARKALAATTFDVSFCDIQCFLPDDPIRLSATINEAQTTTWYKALIEKLRDYAEKTESGAGLLSEDEEASTALVPSEYAVLLSHTITDISYSALNMQYSVNCCVDGIETEIKSNNRHDLCVLSFIDEFNSIVGKDNLLKKCLMLIRAWWVYEATSYVGCPSKHYIPEFALLIMICSVVNRRHREIESPLQALSMFLAEYSVLDPGTQAITLQGTCTFSGAAGVRPDLRPVEEHHALSRDIIDKYRRVFLPHQANVGLDDAHNSYGRVHAQDYGKMSGSRYAASLGDAQSNHAFNRLNFNVMHPFTFENVITEKLSSNRISKIMKIFEVGHNNLLAMLQRKEDIEGFFTITMSRFNSSWRPDALSNTIKTVEGFESSSGGLDPSTQDVDRIWSNIIYYDMVLEAIVTEPALLTLCREILSLKGTLPVGEIGKTLADMTNIPNLSAKLKEKFGGLKKFLERFGDVFVLSKEHPFNPHVLLRSRLSSEQLVMIDGGVIPQELFAKPKKGVSHLNINSSTVTRKQPPTVSRLPAARDQQQPQQQSSSGGGTQGCMPMLAQQQSSTAIDGLFSSLDGNSDLGSLSGRLAVNRAPGPSMDFSKYSKQQAKEEFLPAGKYSSRGEAMYQNSSVGSHINHGRALHHRVQQQQQYGGSGFQQYSRNQFGNQSQMQYQDTGTGYNGRGYSRQRNDGSGGDSIVSSSLEQQQQVASIQRVANNSGGGNGDCMQQSEQYYSKYR